jgi:hypothetical protein
MARSPRPPRLMPTPTVLGAEADAFAPTTQADDEGLAQLAYISGATVGVGDGNTAVSKFIGGLSNAVYSQYMNQAQGQ